MASGRRGVQSVLGQRRRESPWVVCLMALLGVVVCCQFGRRAPAAMDLSRLAEPQPVSARGKSQQAATPVTILGPWTGPTLESFWAVVQPYARRKQIAVDYESTADVEAVLAGRIEEGTAPDVAILPGVALVRRYAPSGQIVPLRQWLDVGELAARYPPGWLELTSVGGEAYGLLFRAVNQSLVWYSPSQFQRWRWAVPASWDELVGLSERIAACGFAPWALGLRGRVADGQAGTDWIENILLRTAGPQVYDQWVRHEIPWTHPAVAQAFRTWGQIVGRPRHLWGGVGGALASLPAEAALALFQDLPGAYLCLSDSAAQPLIAQHVPQQAGGKDYDYFQLPPLVPGTGAPVVAGADVLVVLHATPEAVALVAYLTSAEAQTLWVQRGGFIALGADVDFAAYPDPLSRRAAEQLLGSRSLRFDASAQMPLEVERAFCSAVCQFVADPAQLDSILRSVEEVAKAAYAAAAKP